MTTINLKQLREHAEYARDDAGYTKGIADVPYESLLALLDTAEAAIDTILNWEGCEDEGSCWHMATSHLTRLRETLNHYSQ